jgi:hypothetical protein
MICLVGYRASCNYALKRLAQSGLELGKGVFKRIRWEAIDLDRMKNPALPRRWPEVS